MTLDGSHAPRNTDTAERAAIEAMDAASLQRVKDTEWNAAIEAAAKVVTSFALIDDIRALKRNVSARDIASGYVAP